MEDGAALTLQTSRDGSAEATNATPVVELIINASTSAALEPGNPPPLPIFVGHMREHATRWEQMMTWLPDFTHAVGGLLYRVNCTEAADAIQGVIDCHVLVARAALAHYGGTPGTYLDLEDNCYPTLRADYSLVAPARAVLQGHREWYFLHFSRFPAPIGLVDPETCIDTPLYELGGHVFRKFVGTNELAQAMLCHTDFASMIADPTYVFSGPYDDNFASLMTHVVYPSIIQRRSESQTATIATEFFRHGLGVALRDIAFNPYVYATIDWINAHGGWFSILLLPIIVIACLTSDFVIATWCLLAGAVMCWSLGFR